MNAPQTFLERGLHPRIPMEQYIADPCVVPSLSSGCAHTMLTYSPRHAWFGHPRLNPKYQEATRQDFDIGTCSHALLLERTEESWQVIDPKDYPGERGAIPKGWTTNAIKAARDLARARGKTPLLPAQASAVREMVDIAKDYIAGSEIAGMFDDGAAEQTMVCDEGPVWMRARPDLLSGDHGIIYHYKTTARSAEPDSFGRQMVVQMGYDIAAIFYERVVHSLELHDSPRSIFLIQETEPPYCCSLIGLDPELADLASRKVERAVRLWERCMKTGKWPAYPNRIAYIGVKPWQVEDFEGKEFVERVGQIDPLQSLHGVQV